jgi:type IV secretory pathway VirB2 component (pilin)
MVVITKFADTGANIVKNGITPACGSSCPATSNDLLTVTFPNVTDLLLTLIAGLAVIMIIVGGLRYILSAGNAQKILYSIVGLVVAISAYAIVFFVTGKLGL